MNYSSEEVRVIFVGLKAALNRAGIRENIIHFMFMYEDTQLMFFKHRHTRRYLTVNKFTGEVMRESIY